MLKITPRGIEISIKVIPKAHKNEVVAWEGDALKVRLRAIPEKGEANEELISFLAELLDCAKRDVILLSGKTSRHKRILITALLSEEKRSRILG